MENENKTQQLNQLFEEWEQKVPEYLGKFVKDGILNEKLYNKAAHKILFIEKEPNNPGQEPGDFREWWKDNITHGFSFRIAEWAYGILNNFPEFDSIWENNAMYNEVIHKIAFMNIKKSGGKGVSDYNEMIKHLNQNIEFIHREIEIISPDIVITGVSWPELLEELFPKLHWVKTGYQIKIARNKNYKIIDFYHPSSRTAPPASYCLLQNIIKSQAFITL